MDYEHALKREGETERKIKEEVVQLQRKMYLIWDLEVVLNKKHVASFMKIQGKRNLSIHIISTSL